MGPIDNYEERISNLLKGTIGSIRLKLEHPNFLGVLLYNCGVLEARMIKTKIMKEINDEINWFPIKIPLNSKAKELIERLQKEDKKLYLLTDYLSIEDPIPEIKHILKIDVGSYFS